MLDIRRVRGLLLIVVFMQVVFTFTFFFTNVSLLDKSAQRLAKLKLTKYDDGNADFNLQHNESIRPSSLKQPPAGKETILTPTRMAMEAAEPHYEELLSLQRELLQTQDKFSDEYYGINISLSDTISMDRNISNFMPPVCFKMEYNRTILPTASVIVPFFNEALSVLLRTVHSILNRSPDHLLVDIILVDDLSDRDYLKKPLDEYLSLLPKVKVVRNLKREGLIRARMIGSKMARGDVVIFLDAHSECNHGWLEPLLEELRVNPNTIAQPVVEVIEKATIQYVSDKSNNYHVGVFGWDLKYVWQKVSTHIAHQTYETGHPFFSPTLVGCALAANREYFEKIGEFDEGLEVWGGENIELGFRAWQCGGRITTVPCSRVGHVFKNFPHKFKNGEREHVVAYNLMRVAETWMDGHRKYFYASSRSWPARRREFTKDDWASIKERIELRKQLKCKSFDWFMHHIMPYLETPPNDAIYYGEIESTRTTACWEVLDDYIIGLNYDCYEHKIIPRNFFALTKDGFLKYKDKCVIHRPPSPVLYIAECPTTKAEQEKTSVWWLAKDKVMRGELRVKRKLDNGVWETFCVAQVTNIYDTPLSHKNEQLPNLSRCGTRGDFEGWQFTWKFSWDQVPDYAKKTSLIYEKK